MEKLASTLIVLSLFSTSATASSIAFYVGQWNIEGFYGPEQFDDVATIIAHTGHLFKDIRQFDDHQLDDFAAWIDARIDNGEFDIIWLNGCMPSVLYPFPNLMPNGSRAERWLAGGNMFINTGDWFAYVSFEGGWRQASNVEYGAANILKLSPRIIAHLDGTQLQVTPTGRQYLPSLSDPVKSDRPIVLEHVRAPWEVAALFASSDGTDDAFMEWLADPVVIRNTQTGGYVAFVNQARGGPAGWIDDRGLTCAEFIRNWVAPVAGLGDPVRARNPDPYDRAKDVPHDASLSWTPGVFAATHDVYLGTDLVEVDSASRMYPLDVLARQDQTAAAFTPPEFLEFGTTYYWRIDEVNAAPDFTIFKGDVWSFTVEPYAVPITNIRATASSAQVDGEPQNTVSGVGLNDDGEHSTDMAHMWLSSGAALPQWIEYEFDAPYRLYQLRVWNHNSPVEMLGGFGAKDVTIEYSLDREVWATVDDVPPFAQGTGMDTYTANTIIDLNDIVARFVRLTIWDNWGTYAMVGLSEVQFLYAPLQAREPQPAHRAVGVAVNTDLVWRSGRNTLSHAVYFGTDAEAVATGTAPASIQTTRTYAPASLDFGTTYFWRVDQVGDIETYEGNLWSFTTQEFAIVEDFESYDYERNPMFDVWIDGRKNNTGSVVHHLQTPGGPSGGPAKFMLLAYDNTGDPFYSETEREFLSPQNWTLHGATEASLLTMGYPGWTSVEVVETDGKIDATGAGAGIGDFSDQFTYVYKTLTRTGSMVARVVSNGTGPDERAKGGVMIRQSLDGHSSYAMMALTGGAGRGSAFQWRSLMGDGSELVHDPAPTVEPPYWVRIERGRNRLIGSLSPDGETWYVVGEVVMAMTEPVYIGLCVTSNVVGMDRTFEFDNIETIGTVSEEWKGAVIDWPRHNSPESMYLIVQDSAGGAAMATSDTAATAAYWTRWIIPLSDLAGVDLTSVTKLCIGVGDKDNPIPAGTGTVFIDDIGFGKSAAGQ